MDDTPGVRRGHAAGDLSCPIQSRLERNGSVGDACPEILALEQLGHKVPHAAICTHVVDSDDVRVVQCGDGTSFAFTTPNTAAAKAA